MGLDVSAWRHLSERRNAPDDADVVHVYATHHFPGRTEGLVDGCYEGERLTDWAPYGRFFSCGPYSHYGEWREWLAQLAGYPQTEHPDPRCRGTERLHIAGAWIATAGPFRELLDFFDNEGEIGPVVSAKLARDFAEWDTRALASVSGDASDWRYRLFCNFRRAFDWAADDGCVEFH